MIACDISSGGQERFPSHRQKFDFSGGILRTPRNASRDVYIKSIATPAAHNKDGTGGTVSRTGGARAAVKKFMRSSRWLPNCSVKMSRFTSKTRGAHRSRPSKRPSYSSRRGLLMPSASLRIG